MADSEILNAIHGRRFGYARREIAARKKRFPEKPYYDALDAYCHWASGALAEALAVAQAVRKKRPADVLTLLLLFDVFAGLGKPADGYQAFEMAARKYPSLDLIQAWWLLAQKHHHQPHAYTAAVALREFSNTRHNAFTAALTALWGSPESELRRELDNVAEFEPFSNNEAYLAAELAAKVKDYPRVLELLENVPDKELEIVLLHLDALDRSEEWARLYATSHDLLFAQKFNDFDTWKYLIKAGRHLGKTHAELDALIVLLSRNTYMARLHLCSVFGTGFETALAEYSDKFLTKPCFAADLAGFELPPQFIASLKERKKVLLQQSDLSGTDVTVATNIERLLLAHEPAHRVSWDEYLKFTHPQLSDIFLLSLGPQLLELTTCNILRAISRLRHFASADPENFNIKVWLLRLYLTLSASSLSYHTYETLKVRMIQNDLLSYMLVLEPSAANIERLVQIYRFYLTGDGEVQSAIESALSKRLYTKLPDLYRFLRRLTHSLSRHLVAVQLLRMTRLLGNGYHDFFFNNLQAQQAEIFSDAFWVSENRDFATGMTPGLVELFASERKKSKEYVQMLYAKELLVHETDTATQARVLKFLDKATSNAKYTDQMTPSELHFLKLHMNVFKVKTQTKDAEQLQRYLMKHLDFDKVQDQFLARTSPVSSAATKVLTEVLDLGKVVASTCENNAELREQGKKLQQGLVKYVILNPEMLFFDSMMAELNDDTLRELRDDFRESRFKLKA